MANEKSEKALTQIIKRLDGIIRLILESQYPKKKFSEAFGARVLHSAGLTPTEIARILGKKSATDIAPYLYMKGKTKTEIQGDE
jgi:hypothetical protein